MAKISKVPQFQPQGQKPGSVGGSKPTPQAYLVGGGTARPSKSVSGPIKTKPGC